MTQVSSTPSTGSVRWSVAERVTEALLLRYPDEIHAIGVHGALAHGDDADGTAVEMTVVTYRAGSGPPPSSRRIDGVIVDLDVLSADGCLTMARNLSQSWPLLADRYLTAKAMHDPTGWHDKLRDTHLGYLAEARAGEFAALARQAWCRASTARARTIRLAEWHDTDGAMLSLSEARLAAALADGLLSRTYFRDTADAVRQTGLGEAGVAELGDRLAAQAAVLARRGCPVDGTPDDL